MWSVITCPCCGSDLEVTLEQDYDATLVEIEIVKNSTVVDVLPDGSTVIRPVS